MMIMSVITMIVTTTTTSLLPLVNCTCRKLNVDKTTRRWKKQNGSEALLPVCCGNQQNTSS